MSHNRLVSRKKHVSKHVIAIRSARDRYWVAAIAESSIVNSEPMLRVLRRTLNSCDYSARLELRFEPGRLGKGEESLS